MGEKIKSEFTTRAIALIPIAIGINYVGKTFAHALNLPLYLDVIGTIFAAVLAGPWVGGVAGFATNIIYGLTLKPRSAFFAPLNLAIGLYVGYLSMKGMMKEWWKVLVTGFTLAIVCAAVSSIIVTTFFGGVAGSGVDLVLALMLATGQKFYSAVFTSRVFVELADKILAVYITWLAVKALPGRYAKMFKYSKNLLEK